MEIKDRTTKSSEYDFGEVIGSESFVYDEPVYAKIDFDDEGNVIGEDYSKLDEALENTIIPNEIKTKSRRPNYNGEDKFQSIQLHRLLSYKLSELEMEHAIQYLEERGIRVAGISGSLSDDSNYDYYRTYHTKLLPNPLSKKELQELCIQYYETKDPVIREKIILHSLRLVPFTAYKASRYYKVDQEELESYGYEELIKLVDKYNPYYGASFSTFAIASLNFKYRRNVIDIKSDNFSHIAAVVERAIITVEEYNEKPINGDPQLEEDVVDLVCVMSDYKNKSNLVNLVRNYLYIRDAKRYVSPKLTGDREYDVTNNYDVSKNAMNTLVKDDVRNILEFLTDRERKVIELRFGFYDGRERTLEEVANVFGVTRERIRQIENKAIRKLKHRYVTKKLEDEEELFSNSSNPYNQSNPVSEFNFEDDSEFDDHDFEYNLFNDVDEIPHRRAC